MVVGSELAPVDVSVCEYLLEVKFSGEPSAVDAQGPAPVEALLLLEIVQSLELIPPELFHAVVGDAGLQREYLFWFKKGNRI